MPFSSLVIFGTCEKHKSEIKNILYDIGIPPLLTGYPYIIDATILAKDAADIDVYSEIAFQYDTSPESVERAIRHAIQISWEWEGDRSLKNFYYEGQKIPSNREFFDFLQCMIFC